MKPKKKLDNLEVTMYHGIMKNWDGEMMGGKYDKAQKLGVPVITQADFLKMVN